MLNVACVDAVAILGYDEFVAAAPVGMMCHGSEWLAMIASVTGTRPMVLVASRGSETVGVLPFVLSPDLGEGRVLNTLPFFGSHGGPVCLSGDGEGEVATALLDACREQAVRAGCRAETVILTPFERRAGEIKRSFAPDAEDRRLGQVAFLPDDPGRIFGEMLEPRRRNNVRNALRKGVAVTERADAAAVEWLRGMHEKRIAAKGGIAKPAAFFEWAMHSAHSGGMCSFFFAEIDSRIAAGMLVARFGDAWEYLVPAFDPALQGANALSLLVHEGMRRAAASGARKWNFGGTWSTQHGVYGFKKQFGARDLGYDYLVKIHDPSLLKMRKEHLTAAFPFFFSIPFGLLAS
jgi:hypothetical protein